MIVIDASALVDVLLRTPAATAVEQRLRGEAGSILAPHLIDIEVAQVIRRFAATGAVDEQAGRASLGDLALFPMRRVPHEPLLPRIWELRHSLTACDAAYVALAEALGAPLLTRDACIARAGGHRATIVLV